LNGGVEDMAKHIAEYIAGRDHKVCVVNYNRLMLGGVGSLPREVINVIEVIRPRPTITWSHRTYHPKL
jgi:hypothetical protein